MEWIATFIDAGNCDIESLHIEAATLGDAVNKAWCEHRFPDDAVKFTVEILE